jgi:Co/Zn/Cd efflux system component
LIILRITALTFFVFVIAELFGALLSNSLSLLGDAIAMSVDVMAYCVNIYVEDCKLKYHEINRNTLWLIQIGIPSISVLTIVIITGYVMIDAVKVLESPKKHPYYVDVLFLYGFSITNLVVDVVSASSFMSKGSDIFVEDSARIQNRESTNEIYEYDYDTEIDSSSKDGISNEGFSYEKGSRKKNLSKNPKKSSHDRFDILSPYEHSHTIQS